MAYAADVVLKEARSGNYLGRILRTNGEPKIDIRQTFKTSTGENAFTQKGIRLTLSEMLGMLKELMGEQPVTPSPAAPKPVSRVVQPVKLSDIIEETLNAVRPDPAPAPKAVVSAKFAREFFPNGLPPGTTIRPEKDAPAAIAIAAPSSVPTVADLRARMRKGEKVSMADLTAAISREQKSRKVS